MLNYRKMSIILVVAMLVSLFPQPLQNAANAASSGARSDFNSNGELFLGGNYMELGISSWGDFGTEGSKPAGYFGTNVRSGIGMSVAHEGFTTPGAKRMDYYLPGSPEERFAVGYKVGSNTYNNSNSALNYAQNMPTVISNESSLSEGKLKAKIVTTWTEKMEITQVVSFGENDKIFKNEVTIKNISSETWDNARYMRSLDPDNSVDIGGDFTTENTITHTIEEDGIALVKAEAMGAEKYPLFFYSTDSKAKGSIFGFANDNPYEPEAYDAVPQKGTTIVDDIGMTMTWESHNSLAPGASETFIYYTSLDNRDPSDIVEDIVDDSDGFVEREQNDGSIVGTYQVAIKGGKLQDTIDPAYLTINNLPEGLSLGTFTRISDTVLEFTIAGQALKHESYHSITNASLTIGKENLLVGVKDFTSEPFKITFIDKTKAFIKNSTVTESVYGTGQVTGQLIVSVADGRLLDSVNNADIIVNHLPDGLNYSVTRISANDIAIDVTGTATVLEDVLNASITIKSNVLVGNQGLDVTSNTFNINFYDKEPYLFVENPILKESITNDGTFAESIKLKLVNAQFKDRLVIDELYTVTDAVYGFNLPVGIEIDNYTIDSPTELTVMLKGTAVYGTSLDDITNAQIGINPNIVEQVSPTIVIGDLTINSNTLYFYFIDDEPTMTVQNKVIMVEQDYTIPTKVNIKLNHGTFDSALTVSDVQVNNMPTGVMLSDVTVLSSNEIELTFAVSSPESFTLDASSTFASITVAAGKVIGSIKDLTSEIFKFDVRLLDDITWDNIKIQNASINDVKTNLNLVDVVTGGKVVWTSSNESVISTKGIVTPSLTTDENVTLTAVFTIDGSNVTRTFNVIVTKLLPELQLKEVEVKESNPNEVKLTFSQPLAPSLETVDFNGFTIDGRRVIAVTSIVGQVVTVKLDEPLGADSELVVLYDPSIGNIKEDHVVSNELVTITAADQNNITVKNSIEPLYIVTSFVKDGKLKIVFNKEIDADIFDLTGLTFGGVPLTGSYDLIGNELTVSVDANSDSQLMYTPGHIQEENNENNKLVVPSNGIDLGTTQSYIDSRGTLTSPISFNNGSNSLIQIKPEFDVNRASGYMGRVGGFTKNIYFTSIPSLQPNTFAKAYVNGKEIDLSSLEVPVREAGNTIIIKIFDALKPNVLLGQYEMTILVDVVVDSSPPQQNVGSIVNGSNVKQPIQLFSTRTKLEGKTIENVTITSTHAQQAVGQSKDDRIQTIIINIPNDSSVDEVETVIEKSAFNSLASNKIGIEFYGKGAAVKVDGAALEDLEEDLYIRLIPVKEKAEQEQLNKQAKVLANHSKLAIVGQPMQVKTNLVNKDVKVFLPLGDITIPTNADEKAKLFKRLGIYASFGDGKEALLAGKLVSDVNGKLGLEFTVNKEGTFSIAKVTTEADRYIVGYPDGQFKPEAEVSRGQIALMFARNLSYNKDAEYSSTLYKDLSAKHFASSAINFVTQQNIMNGYSDGSFKADGFITRAEMMSLVVKYQGYDIDEHAELKYTDTTGHWAQYMIEAARKNGIIVDDKEVFNPDEQLTRVEAVMIINQLFDRQPITDVTTPSFSDVSVDHPAFGHIEEAVREYSNVFMTIQ